MFGVGSTMILGVRDFNELLHCKLKGEKEFRIQCFNLLSFHNVEKNSVASRQVNYCQWNKS